MRESKVLAVAVRGIEPATFEHCALIRDWLTDLGVDRVTLLVIPAADHHPFFQRSPALAEWLRERRDGGDCIAQQGFVGAGGKGAREAAEHVRAGRRLMELAGLEPSGYEAPSLAHAFGARRELISSFDWWMAPGLWRAGTLLHRARTLRIDVRPEDMGSPRRTRALERTLRTEAAHRRSVTYADLAADAKASFNAEAARVLRPS
jgi:predicted deacetylase